MKTSSETPTGFCTTTSYEVRREKNVKQGSTTEKIVGLKEFSERFLITY